MGLVQCLGTSLIFYHYLINLCSPATNDLSHSQGPSPGAASHGVHGFSHDHSRGQVFEPTSRRYLPHQSRPPSSPRRDPRPSPPRCCRHWPWSLVKLAVTWNMGNWFSGLWFMPIKMVIIVVIIIIVIIIIVGFCGYMMGYMNNTGWWFQPTPLKNDGVRQLGWWHSQLNGKIKFMFQTTNMGNIW